MGADYSKVHRLLQIILLMQQGRAGDAASLAQALGVVERTIYRDLEVLADLGVPYFVDPDVGGYCIHKDFFLPPVQLSTAEALAVLCLGESIGRTDQIALSQPAAKAIEKIRGQLPKRVLQELGDLDQHINIRLPATGPAGEAIRDVFGLVQQAIRTRRALCCRYESLSADRDEAEFLFRPYVLSFDQRAWYTIGDHGGRNDVRRLKLNRFTAVSPTDRPYAIPDDFSLVAFRGKAWRMIRGDRLFKVVIDFDRDVAETVSDTNWHATQEINLHEDGAITFECEVEGLDEIVWWVLGYGPHAVVREPLELADRIAELAKATAGRYARR